MDWDFGASILKIVAIDLALSGDNAVMIALAAHRLPERQKRIAILCGGCGAILLRVALTVAVAKLLDVPFLRLAAGLVLIWIAVRLLLSEEREHHHVQPADSLPRAVWTIIAADLIMSLENMLAVGGASEGNMKLLAFGLFLSIAIIMASSAVIARLMDRFPVLVTAGAGVLALTAGGMIVRDGHVSVLLAGLPHGPWIGRGIVLSVVAGVVTCPRWLKRGS